MLTLHRIIEVTSDRRKFYLVNEFYLVNDIDFSHVWDIDFIIIHVQKKKKRKER